MSVIVEVWTDGSGLATGGAIGWAYVLRALSESGEVLKMEEGSGGEEYGTNNRAELLAVAEGLYALQRPARVTVVSDSEYVLDGFRRGRVERWKRNGWVTKEGEPVLYQDLWTALDSAAAFHEVEWRHVKGHRYIWRCENPGCAHEADNGRKRSCAKCAERGVKAPVKKHAVYPLNERCDALAGAERAKLLPAATH